MAFVQFSGVTWQYTAEASAGRSELHYPKVITGGEVGIQPPAQPDVKLLGAVYVGNRQHHDLESHVHGQGPLCRRAATTFVNDAGEMAASRADHTIVDAGIREQ